MRITRIVIGMFSIATMVLSAAMVSGQDYPNKPIRIVTSPIGGGADFAARLIAQGIAGPLGQSVVVDNRAGVIAMPQVVAQAPPDGYTMLFLGGGLWLLPFMQDNVPWDVDRDFTTIASATNSPLVVVVNSSFPVKSVTELIALAKAKPGVLNYADGGAGGASHLGPELFKAMAGVNIVRIPYKGAAGGLNALLAGEVQMMIASASAVSPHVKSGRLHALAVTSAQPSALFPGMPTVAASGLPGYEASSRQGLWAPAKTPANLVRRLNEEIVRALSKADIKERLLRIGVEAAPSSPEEFVAIIKAEQSRMGKVIKDAGIRAE